jgi:hypothetical protein
MPYGSWHKLHHREGTQPQLPIRCPVCREERKVTTHLRKVFLVAKRLTWDDKLVSAQDKVMNEELNWRSTTAWAFSISMLRTQNKLLVERRAASKNSIHIRTSTRRSSP